MHKTYVSVSVRSDDLTKYLNEQSAYFQGKFEIISIVYETQITVLVVFAIPKDCFDVQDGEIKHVAPNAVVNPKAPQGKKNAIRKG